MTAKRYDAAQVTMVFMGILIDSGFADGEFLTIEQSAADYEATVGSDGEVARSRTNNRHAVIKVKLMQTSDGNGFLSGISNVGLLAKNGTDIGPMLVRDRISGVCTYTAAECWVAKPPDVSFSRGVEMREWTLECAELVRVDAGS